MITKEELKKKIVYRSKSMGCRELSLIFENVLAKNIDSLNYDELTQFLNFVSMDDMMLKHSILAKQNSFSFKELKKISHESLDIPK